MNEREQQLESLELSIEEQRVKINRMQALARLEKNEDFKKIFDEGFLRDHAVRQVMLKSHPSMITDEGMQKVLDNQIAGCGALKQFLIAIYQEGRNAEIALAEDQATMEEIHAEDLG